jgi:dolichol kinase
MGINIFTIPVMGLCFLNGILYYYYAYKLNKKYPDRHNFINSILIITLWFLAGILFPLFFPSDTANSLFFQGLAFQIICIYAPLLILTIVFFQYQFRIKPNKRLKSQRTIESFIRQYDLLNDEERFQKSHSFNIDLHRKAFHLIPAVVIIALWLFAINIWEGVLHANIIWGINGQEYGRFLILTVGYTGIMIFAALDYMRLSYIFEKRTAFHLLPHTVSNLLVKTLKRREIYEFTKPVALVLSFVPIFFFPFSIFASSALIASLGDGASSLCGIRFGKRFFPKGSDKTIAGYIAGTIVSFLTSFCIMLLFEPAFYLLKTFIIACTGALVYLSIDLLSLRVDDNITNPILCGMAMALIYYVF